MKSILCILLVVNFLFLEAQNRKVDMLKDRPVSEIFNKAKKERKYVLLDFGSPRCGPCLYIKNQIFTIDSVADFINEHFVSADYTQGEEKKRLSKIYGVYLEPVILITDIKGNLMHRMEGKCSATEMLERLKQGLDKEKNLVALQKKYEKGERDVKFLISYLETLHIAGLREEKAEILKNIFPADFDLELLKTTEYWELFLRYNESPVTKEACFVFKNRSDFYKLFGENIVRGKFNSMFGGRVRMYTYGQVPPMDIEEYRKMLNLLQDSDYENSTEWLAYLVPAQYKFKDWKAMVKAIQAVIDFNVFLGKEKYTYMIMLSRQICWYSDDIYALQYALKWMDIVISKASKKDLAALNEERKMIVDKVLEILK